MALHMGPKAVYDSKGFSGDPVGRERRVKKNDEVCHSKQQIMDIASMSYCMFKGHPLITFEENVELPKDRMIDSSIFHWPTEIICGMLIMKRLWPELLNSVSC